MQFGRDFAEKQLRSHMFRDEHDADTGLWGQRIAQIIANLTSSSKHLTHGRMITSQQIKADNDLQHLKVQDLPTNDPYWTAPQ